MRNVEAKFRLRNPARALELAIALGFERRDELSQRDTFFVTASGKLKLRQEAGAGGACLIYYNRRDSATLQLSDYEIVPVVQPDRMRAILAEAMGVLAEVIKHRTLLMRHSVRLHIDRVEGLGEYGEIEAVLSEGESEDANLEAVARLLNALEISDADRVRVSYFELILGARS